MVDRKFAFAAVWSLLAGFCALFGLINSSSVGFLVKNSDDGWRFTVGYMLMAVLFGCLEYAQRRQWVEGQETEPDDLSSVEWIEWKRQQQQLEARSQTV